MNRIGWIRNKLKLYDIERRVIVIDVNGRIFFDDNSIEFVNMTYAPFLKSQVKAYDIGKGFDDNSPITIIIY